jgi:SAM-dependent methyltransferase
VKADWFASWFDSEHYHRLYVHRSDEEAARFVDALIAQHRLHAGAAVLDLGCGTGRHSKRLASQGFDVTGVDLSAESLRAARTNESVNLRFMRQDMRLPFGSSAFDCVVNLFTSFGYFEDPADNLTVIRNVAESLKPGGAFILDYLNVRHAESHLAADEVTERDGVSYHISRWTDAAHIFKRITIDDHRSQPLEWTERVAKLGLEDFRFMLALCDLTIEAAYGDYQLSPFDDDASPRLILVARTAAIERRRLPARKLPADAADRFGRHTEVRREHGLGHPLNDRRVHAEEFQVALLGGRAQRADDPLVLGGGVTLQAGAERGRVAADLVDELLVRRTIDQENVRILDRVDEER